MRLATVEQDSLRTSGRASSVLATLAVVILVLVASMTLVTPSAGAAVVPVPVPDDDPFYAAPPGLANMPNGAVLAVRPVTAMAQAAPIPAKAWQVKYKTIDQRGRPSAFVTTVLVPIAPWTGSGPRPLVSYQVAIDTLSTKCAPSFVMRAGLAAALTGGQSPLQSNAAQETNNIEQAIARGYAVTVPDWEGPNSDWVADAGAARSVLDGIRATLHTTAAGVSKAAPIGLVGYSGGALATNWAVQKQSSYAPELRFRAVALGGTPADIEDSIDAFRADKVGRGAVALLLASLQRSYPQWHIERVLSSAGRTAVANGQHDCLFDALTRNANADTASYERTPGSLYNNPTLSAHLASISPLNYPGHQGTPILFYHATQDQFASVDNMHRLASRYCGEGRAVHIVESPVGDHISYVLAGFPTALDYLATRFSGAAAPNDCPQ